MLSNYYRTLVTIGLFALLSIVLLLTYNMRRKAKALTRNINTLTENTKQLENKISAEIERQILLNDQKKRLVNFLKVYTAYDDHGMIKLV